MTTRDIAILNSLVTFAAENIPGGLSEDEEEIARIVGAWTLDGVPIRRVCPHCLEVAPYDDHNLPWLPAPWLKRHMDDPIHRMWWALRNRLYYR